MAHLVCVPCKMQMKPEKNGVYFIEYASFGPYCIWHTDRYECPKCGQKVLSGFGVTPIYHHEATFKPLMAYAMTQSTTIEEVR